ncbi:MAG: ABC transporter C-terminal domain-containing protein [Candidatus Sulfotelmatobacter sp.]
MEAKRVAAEDPTIASDSSRLMTAHAELEEAQNTVDVLYARWAELEKKQQA